MGRLGCQVGRLGGHVGRLGRQVGSPRRSKRRLEPSPRSLRTHACDRPTARTLGRRFFVDFVLSRGSGDVPRVPVFTMFCWLRTKSAPNARKRPRRSEFSRFGLPNRRQERLRRLENPARAAKASAKSEVQPQFFSQVRPNSRTEPARTQKERMLERKKTLRLRISGFPSGNLR